MKSALSMRHNVSRKPFFHRVDPFSAENNGIVNVSGLEHSAVSISPNFDTKAVLP